MVPLSLHQPEVEELLPLLEVGLLSADLGHKMINMLCKV